MTEQEIIKYLKENRYKGVAFMLMPVEVKRWCKEHEYEAIFLHLSSNGWDCTKRPISTSTCNAIHCLADDYETKPAFKPYFVEFDVNENGYFYYEGKEYYYRDDVAFEKHNSDTFKGFGGWLYECDNGPLWVTIPHFASKGNLYWYMKLDGKQHEVTVPIPTRIRFWRYKE